MADKLFFDTLNYAKLLEKEGIDHADTFAQALAKALAQNIYTTSEIDTMIEEALKRTDDAIKQFEKRTQEIRLEMHNDMQELRNDINKRFSETESKTVSRLTLNLGIISAFLAIVASIVHYLH